MPANQLAGPAQELALARTELARTSLSIASTEVPDPVAHLERLSLTHFGPIDGHEDNLITAFFVGSTKTLVNALSSSLEFFRSIMDRDDAEDYQTVRDLALIGLCGIDSRRPYHGGDLVKSPGATRSSTSRPWRTRGDAAALHVNPFVLPAGRLSPGPDFGRII